MRLKLGFISNSSRLNRFFIMTSISTLLSSVLLNEFAYADCERETYTVKKGDILSNILNERKERYHVNVWIYGKGHMVSKTLALNPSLGSDPTQIAPGMKIELPEELSPNLASARECAGHSIMAQLSGPDMQEFMKSQMEQEKQATTVAVKMPNQISADTVANSDAAANKSSTSPSAHPEEATHPRREVASEETVHQTKVEELMKGYSPLKNRLDLGLGLIVVDNLATIPALPQFYVNSRIQLGESLDLLPLVAGFLPSYSYTSTTYNAMEGQFRLGVGYRFLEDHLTVGLGGRYFTFGYTGVSNAQASSIDGVFLLGYSTQISDAFELQIMTDTRVSFSMSGASADSITSSTQLSGFGVIVQGHYLLSNQFYLGPYVSVDNVSLTWNQSTGSSQFFATEFGAGLHVGLGF